MAAHSSLLRKIRRELERKSVIGLRQAGRLLNKAMNGKAQYAQLKRWAGLLGDERKVSLLQQASRLAHYWSQKDAQEASTAGLSIRRAIALVALDGLAERYSDAGEDSIARRIRAERRRLQRKGEKLKSLDLLAVKIQYASSGRKRKRVSDSQRFILSQLSKAQGRLLADVTLGGSSGGEANRRLISELDRLAERVKRRYALILKEIV